MTGKMALQIVLDCAEKENGRIAGKIAMTTKFMLTPAHRNRIMEALQIVLDNSSGCTGMLAMTRAWAERYRVEVWEFKVCFIAKEHFIADDLLWDENKPGHWWDDVPANYDEWLQRYKQKETLDDWRDWHDLCWDLRRNLAQAYRGPPTPESPRAVETYEDWLRDYQENYSP